MSFATFEFSDTLVKSMNQDKTLFNSQHILVSLASISPSFVFDLAHDNDYNVIGIVWMISYMHDKFKRFSNNLSIDVMSSSIYTIFPPVVKNGIIKINVVCERFVINEAHDAYTFILELLLRCVL